MSMVTILPVTILSITIISFKDEKAIFDESGHHKVLQKIRKKMNNNEKDDEDKDDKEQKKSETKISK